MAALLDGYLRELHPHSTEGLRAHVMAQALNGARLPECLLSGSVHQELLLAELNAGLRYTRSSEAERAIIVQGSRQILEL